ncbi:hypothetical protein [Tortoise microvirus 71]|nr:hypothetical protein [Tortoise microvirus 71]
MTVKLRHVGRWKRLEGPALELPGERRLVRIDVNVDAPTRLDLIHEGGRTFLTVVEPGAPAKVEFAVEGDCIIEPTTDGEVWWSSDDGQTLAFAVDTESFTQLSQRSGMTAEMEVEVYKSQLRAEQRRAEVAELLLAQERRKQAEDANADPETGEVKEDGEPVGTGAAAAEGGEGAGGSTPPKS